METGDGANTVPPFPFIVGCGRSGTELLRAILTSHSSLAIPQESKFVPGASVRFDGDPFPAERFLDWFAAKRLFSRHWKLDVESLRAAFDEDPPTDYPQAVRAMYQQMADRQDKERYADKTPSYVTEITRLARLFPESVFIHLIRDGRDVAGSLNDAHFGPNHLGAAALYWQERVVEGRRQGTRLGDRYLEVRYEALVADPTTEVERICRLIEIEFEASMLDYHEDDALLGALLTPARHERVAEPPSIGRDWRRDRSRSEVALMEALVGETLIDFGYDTTRTQPPLWARSWAVGYRMAARTKQVIGR